MSYRDRQRLSDIQAAIGAIRSHLQRGTLDDGLVFDAVRIRLLEIGEAVKALPAELLDTQPGIPWRDHERSTAIGLDTTTMDHALFARTGLTSWPK